MTTSSMPADRSGARFVQAPEALRRRSLDRVLLLHPEHGDILTLVGTGASLWDVLTEPVTLGEGALILAEAYGADVDEVARDITPVLTRLVDDGLVRVLS